MMKRTASRVRGLALAGEDRGARQPEWDAIRKQGSAVDRGQPVADGFFHPRDTRRALPMALLRAREAVMARFRPMLKRHGITEQQWRIVRVLAEAEEIEVTHLAARTSILGPSLSRILPALEHQKLITRRQDDRDGRVFWLGLTPAGRALIARVQPDSVAIYADIEARLGHETIEALLDRLAELVAALETPGAETAEDGA
jgi:homoprotocatechuate degradation regulator HpaR